MSLRFPTWIAPSLLIVAGVALPPKTVAELAHAAAPGLTAGLWLFKLGLIASGVALALAARQELQGTATTIWPGSAPPGAARWELPALTAILILAVVLRIPGLGRGLWFDEIQTLVDYIRRPLGELLTTFDTQNQHLLYSLLARGSVLAFGESAATLRLPALGLGVLSIFAYQRFARRVVAPGEALLGAAALAVSYHHVWFSQNARGYTGLLCFALFGTLAFHRLMRDPAAGRATVVGYALAMALACYTHITAVFIVIAHGLIAAGLWLTRARERPAALARPAWAIGLAGLFAFTLYAPIIPQFASTLVRQSPYAADTAWESPLWLLMETVRGLAQGLPGGWLALIAGLTVVGAGLWSLWRLDRVLIPLLVLPGILTAAAVLALGHNLWPRFFFFSAGFAVLIAVRGGFALATGLLGERARRPAWALAVLVLLASAYTVRGAWGPKQDFGRAAEFVDRSKGAEDAVVTVDLTIYPYSKFYLRPWNPVESLDALEQIENTHQRTWLLYTFPVRLAVVQPGIWDRLSSHYDTAAVYPGTVGGGAIVVMVTRSRPNPSAGTP